MNNDIIISIDGPAASGKSTIAKLLAKKLNYKYIDSGAMYRCVSLYQINNKLNNDALVNELAKIKISFDTNNKVFLNNVDVTTLIRNKEVTDNVSKVAMIKEVRAYLVYLQQQYGKDKGIVMDGRDIGSVVFKDAEVKIYLEASVEARAKRRYQEDKGNKKESNYQEICNSIIERDHNDMNREISPLIKPDDAIEIDSSNDTIDETLNKIINVIDEKVKM